MLFKDIKVGKTYEVKSLVDCRLSKPFSFVGSSFPAKANYLTQPFLKDYEQKRNSSTINE